jgi:hypothetical protein
VVNWIRMDAILLLLRYGVDPRNGTPEMGHNGKTLCSVGQTLSASRDPRNKNYAKNFQSRKVASLNSGKGFAAPRLTTGENQLDNY